MSDEYIVMSLAADSPETVEQLGSKPKFWFRVSGDPQPWLFKYTRENTGEAWSEKIAAEIGELLGVPHARVELATFGTRQGCASRSFVLKEHGWDLIHGSEILAGRVLGYDRRKYRRQSDHNLPNVFEAVAAVMPEHTRNCHLTTLAGFIVLDALIGNTDRHHDNWGVLARATEEGDREHEMAPSFDHASSLGRELTDAKRERWLSEGRLAEYLARGHGGIYWQPTDAKGDNPLNLAIRAARAYPERFRPWLDRVRSLDMAAVESAMCRVPESWMSRAARRFGLAAVQLAADRLKEVTP
jgi:hypothetical protein